MLAGALPELVNEFLDVLEISKYCNRLSAVQNIHHNIKVSSFYNNKLKLNMANNEFNSTFSGFFITGGYPPDIGKMAEFYNPLTKVILFLRQDCFQRFSPEILSC